MLFNITGVMTIVTFCVLFQSGLVPTQIKCMCQSFAATKNCSTSKRDCIINISLVLSMSVLCYLYQSCVICQSKNHTFCECTIPSSIVCMKQLCCQNGVLLTPCPGSFWQLKPNFQWRFPVLDTLMLWCMHVVLLRKVHTSHNVIVYFILFCVYQVVLHEMVTWKLNLLC